MAHPWYYSWRSTRVLRGLNERAQTLDEQLQIISKALSLDPRNFNARFWFARKLVEKKKYREAAEAWAQVRQRSQYRGITDTSFADQGMGLLFAHRQAEAIPYLEETIRRRRTMLLAEDSWRPRTRTWVCPIGFEKNW